MEIVTWYSQNNARKNAALKYFDGFEKSNYVKINHRNMVNQNAISENPCKSYQFYLIGRTEAQRFEIIEKSKELMYISSSNTLEINFKGIGGANDRAYKGYIEAFISQFEMNNKITISYNSRIYEMNQGGELYTIQLHNLTDSLKIQFVKDVNKLFNQANAISIRMY